jgi:hypothetical protein
MIYHLLALILALHITYALPQDRGTPRHPRLEARDNQVPLPDPNAYFAIANSCDPNMLCNSSGCYGSSFEVNSTYGICMSGMCTGVTCKNSCPSTTPNCPDCSGSQSSDPIDPNNNPWTCGDAFYLGCPCNPTCSSQKPMCKDCAGINHQDSTDSVCNRLSIQTAGSNFGCPCQSSCPTTSPSCDDSVCSGISYPDGTGQCQMGPLQGCTCTSVCPSAPPSCGDTECSGYNQNSGLGTCLSGKYSGCVCISTCIEVQEKTCNVLPGCEPLLAQHGPGQCTAGRYRGCSCDSQCPLPLIGCRDPKCQGTTLGLCEYGPLIGCQCDITG